jgi:hypothetical protein
MALKFNVQGRDLGSVISEAQAAVAPIDWAAVSRCVSSSGVRRLERGRAGEMPYCWIRGAMAAWSSGLEISRITDEALSKAASTLAEPQGVSGRSTWTVPNR